MWQAPNQRLRSIVNAKKRERDKARRPIHIKRIGAVLEVSGPPEVSIPEKAEVRLILNDLSVKGAGLFSAKEFTAGQTTCLHITDPMALKVNARIVWCREHDTNSHVISSQPYSYRLGLEFLPANEDEKKALKDFCDEVGKTHLYTQRAG